MSTRKQDWGMMKKGEKKKRILFNFLENHSTYKLTAVTNILGLEVGKQRGHDRAGDVGVEGRSPFWRGEA